MKRKLPFVLSFALAALIVVGQTSFADGSDNNNEVANINGNSTPNVMHDEMMNNSNMSNMMEACMNFMQSFGGNQENK